MRNLLLGLLVSLASLPLFGQVTITGMTLEDVTIVAAASSTPAPDWTSYMAVVYDFEEVGDPWKNHDNASGGSGCDANANGTAPSRETGAGDFIQGTAAGYFQDSAAEGEYLWFNCAGYELDDQDVSWGGWFNYEDDGYATAFGRIASNSGMQVRRDSSGDTFICQVGNGVSAPTHTPGDTWTAGVWYHAVCAYDDTDSSETLDLYINGDDDDSAATSAAGGTDLTYGWVANNQGASDQRADDVFKYAGLLTKAEAARIAACGVDGGECTCNGTAYVDYGKTDESCDGSEDPWGCCTGDGTGCIDQDLLTDDCNKAQP